MQDPENRMNVLSGNPAKTDTIDLQWTAPKSKTWDMMNSIGGNNGEFCYIYV
jgi:tyrosinase